MHSVFRASRIGKYGPKFAYGFMMLQFHLFDLDKDRMIDYHELKVSIF